MPRLPTASPRLLVASSTPSSWSLSCTSTSTSHRHASSRSGSSAQWLQRQRQDPFVRARASGELDPSSPADSSSPFVSRSAFKLVELQQKSRGTLIRPGMCIVDLGAAPGGWVQAAARELAAGTSKGKRKGNGVIVGVDLLPLSSEVASLDGVSFVRGDFLDPVVQAQVVAALAEAREGGKGGAQVDLVLSDMLANLSGNNFRDGQLSIDLCEAALAFALDNLAPSKPPSADSQGAKGKKKRGPSLVMKCLQSSLSPAFQDLLKEHFEGVAWSKPSSSRPESREGYWVCSGLKAKKRRGQDSWEGDEGEGDGIYF
ncbi:FtsJ-like methyltransferase-domain-containing protein [Leucosporidium creatinivorum]|uniref:rRNA methyltransferase 2, mitochondrial n=1 Tax=Leucosporidium creatinivorum TaxID=106004 RepID=A0A1Y2G034_9BASI|nr:FtsJ-like methyltransferase-domain-containing protein [Leucosporidium creatinivorum]